LRGYEQAKSLTIELLKKWLVKYKFKNWDTHKTNPDLIGQPVTLEQKEQRAKEIETAFKEFEVLVEKGLTKRRGYNLMSITDVHLHRLTFNTADENTDSIQHSYLSGFMHFDAFAPFTNFRTS